MKIVNLNKTSCTIRANNAAMICLLMNARDNVRHEWRTMQEKGNTKGMRFEQLVAQDEEYTEMLSALENNC